MDGSSIIDQLAEAPLSELEQFLAAIQERIETEELEIQLEDARLHADAIRAECAKSFAAFIRRAWKIIEPGTPLRWGWHLQAIADHLQAISEGRLRPRLIINVSPGSSKSTLVSVLWQAWLWGPYGKPHLKFLTSSFDGDNVTRDTRKTRDLIQSEWYRTLWPEVFDERGKLKRSGETSFANKHTGTREGVAFYSILGKRGDVVVIDDPHSLLSAESDTQRKKATRAFVEGGLNRVNDEQTSAIVIVMQRLHADDLTGALLALDVGFIHLMIPMEFETARRCTTPLQVVDGNGSKKDWTDPRSYEGELMDPVRFPQASVDQKKKSPYSYAGQYAQRPAPREGGLFKVDKIRTVEYPEPGGKLVRGWDLAASIEEGAAYTVGVLMRLLPDGQIYIEDVVRFRGTPFEVDRKINETARADGPNVKQSLPQDPGAAGKAVKWNFARLLAGMDFEVTPETGDKETRARPFASQVEAGTVAMVHASWNSDYIEELRNFPTGSYKDQVDASSRAYSKLIAGHKVPENAAPEIIDGDGVQFDHMLVDASGEEIDPWS